MRITDKMAITPYLTNLEGIQNRRTKADIQISTGKLITNMADDPIRLTDSKQLNTMMEQNKQYIKNLDTSLGEIRMVSDQFNAISDKFQKIRELTVDAMNVGNHSNLFSIGVYLKGILTDIVRDANLSYNGIFTFSGTKTTPDSLDKTAEAPNDMPFELVEGISTPENRSGLKVVFKGNNEDRFINKDKYTAEPVNSKAETMFGVGGTEVFDSIIKLYNLLTFTNEGKTRKENDLFTREDFNKVNDYQKTIAVINDQVVKAGAENGALMNRFEGLQQQLIEENTRLKEILSLKEDTDIAKTSLDLKREENALQYTLQIGSKLIPNSLFDFLR